MSDRLALTEAIRSHPGDDTPRLILADWYEENGDPARGEFIRVQCELARLDPSSDRSPELHLRQLQILAEHERDWLGEWADRLVRWEFRRGMLEEVTVCPEPYCRGGEELFRDHPLWRVAFVDGEGESLNPDAIRDVLGRPHSRHLRAIEAAGCSPDEFAAAMFGGQIRTNVWLAELARVPALAGLRELSLFGGTRSGRDDIDPDAWKAFCAAEHLRGLTHLDLSNCYDYHGDSAEWEPILRTLAGAAFAPALHSLQLGGCYTGPDALAHLTRSRRFADLRALVLGRPVRGESIAADIATFLDPEAFPQLRELTLPYGRHLADLATHPGWTRLERIGLFGTDDHEDRTRSTHEPIWRAFCRSPHVRPKALLLGTPGYFDPEEVGAWDALAGAAWFGDLRELGVGFYNRSCAPLLERATGRFPRVHSLALSPDTELVERLAAWPGLSNLVSLRLNDSHGTTDPGAAVKLFTSPYLTARLSRLGVNGLCHSPEAVAALANCSALAGLQHLDLAFNELSEASASLLAASPHLRNLRSLHTWSEWDESVTPGWLTLADPHAFPQLRDVVIGSGTPERVQNDLRRRFGPRLRVFADC